MDWLPVAVVVLIWIAFLVPWPSGRREVARGTFPDLRYTMELRQDSSQLPGRWVMAPKKGTRFVGPRERARLRARERRRRVVVVLLEAIGLTALMGVFPPLRPMLLLTAVLAVMLLGFLAMVVVMMGRERPAPDRPMVVAAPRTRVHPDAADNPSLREDQERLARVLSR